MGGWGDGGWGMGDGGYCVHSGAGEIGQGVIDFYVAASGCIARREQGCIKCWQLFTIIIIGSHLPCQPD